MTMHSSRGEFNGDRTGVLEEFVRLGNGNANRGRLGHSFSVFAHLWGCFGYLPLRFLLMFMSAFLAGARVFFVHSLWFFFFVIELLFESSHC